MSLGKQLPLAGALPFLALLSSIALFPLLFPHWWENNRNKAWVALLCCLPVIIYMGAVHGSPGLGELLHKCREYCSFLILLGSLFVITSGIYIAGSLAGTPLGNSVLLGIGAVLASFMGTTGASVFLIRPLLRANRSRAKKAHVVIFFIFIVCNCGGLLTPIGDPPLFLGFLNGVPFTWTFRLWKEWLVVNGILLLVFQVIDQIIFDREEAERPGSQLEEVMKHEPIRIRGTHHFIFLSIIMAIIFASGTGLGYSGNVWPFGWQEALMAGVALASYLTTSPEIRTLNRFSFAPIVEVAVLFAGIFVTMAPALLILNARGAELGIRHPWQYFWATGALSGFLDNAPTYLAFAATACGRFGIALDGKYLSHFLSYGSDAANILSAISCGAVFMGANTYVGNGPNFMIKAIAEENGVKMPGFFRYMAWSIGVLIPIFIGVTLLFFV